MNSNESENKFIRFIKKTWQDPVGSKMISIGLIALIPYIYGLSKDIRYGQVWKMIYNFEVRLIYVVIVSIVIYFINRQMKRSSSKMNQVKTNSLPVKPTYLSDNFGKSKTEWSWDLEWDSYKNSWNIINLTPNCDQCGTKTEIEKIFNTYMAVCSKCSLDGLNARNPLKESQYDVGKAIVRKSNQ